MRLRRVLPIWLVLLSLALGLLATAASVWVASSRHKRHDPFNVPPVTQWTACVLGEDRHDIVVGSFGMGVEFWASSTYAGRSRPSRLDAHYASVGPADDLRPPFARAETTTRSRSVHCLRAGWPLLAAEGRHVHSFAGQGAGRKVEAEWIVRASSGTDMSFVPLRPIPLGVLANTLFYATPTPTPTPTLILLATVRLGLIAWRTRRRTKRGRCPACGYELGEGVAVCPECGRGRATEANAGAGCAPT